MIKNETFIQWTIKYQDQQELSLLKTNFQNKLDVKLYIKNI